MELRVRAISTSVAERKGTGEIERRGVRMLKCTAFSRRLAERAPLRYPRQTLRRTWAGNKTIGIGPSDMPQTPFYVRYARTCNFAQNNSENKSRTFREHALIWRPRWVALASPDSPAISSSPLRPPPAYVDRGNVGANSARHVWRVQLVSALGETMHDVFHFAISLLGERRSHRCLQEKTR